MVTRDDLIELQTRLPTWDGKRDLDIAKDFEFIASSKQMVAQIPAIIKSIRIAVEKAVERKREIFEMSLAGGYDFSRQQRELDRLIRKYTQYHTYLKGYIDAQDRRDAIREILHAKATGRAFDKRMHTAKRALTTMKQQISSSSSLRRLALSAQLKHMMDKDKGRGGRGDDRADYD
jgi:pyridoxine 5'-phosphate synthase PdxJ